MRLNQKTYGKMTRPVFRMAACLLTLGITISSGPPQQAFRLFSVSDAVRVFEDGYNLPPRGDTIKVFGIRGETVSGQFVLYAERKLDRVTVEVTLNESPTAGNSIRAEDIEWNFVGSVPLSENTPNQPPGALSRTAPALYPDYLMAEKQLSVESGSYQSVWLTVSIPPGAVSGSYAGLVRVRCSEGEQSIPLQLRVYPLSLPSERHLDVVEWYSTEGFERFHGIREIYSDEWFAMLGKYADNMAAHRQNVFRVPMNSIGIRRTGDGTYGFDFSVFDEIASVFWNTGKMDYLETGFLTRFGEGDWFSTEILLKDIPVTDARTGKEILLPGEEVVPHLLPAFEAHLRQKGWLNRTLFHVKDEPSLHNALAWRAMSSYIHRCAPDLRRMDAIETTFLLDDIEVAVPKLDALGSWYETYRDWEQEGHELWFYTVGIYQGSYFPNKTIDMPLIETRILHWLNYRFDVSGYLHWGWNQWNEDPYRDAGMHIGDAWHVYPVRDGVLNSIRWEEMRNGIQDYEYFWLLEQKISSLKDSLGSRFSWIEPSSRGKEIAGRVVMSLADHTEDPEVMYGAKTELVRELLDFDVSPKIYVQTDPVENTVLTNNSSVAVYGWTEPGNRIIINGQDIPVSEQGLFVEQFEGEINDTAKIRLGDVIRVQAIGPEASREIVRHFFIRY
jgi:hypothetical protein